MVVCCIDRGHTGIGYLHGAILGFWSPGLGVHCGVFRLGSTVDCAGGNPRGDDEPTNVSSLIFTVSHSHDFDGLLTKEINNSFLQLSQHHYRADRRVRLAGQANCKHDGQVLWI